MILRVESGDNLHLVKWPIGTGYTTQKFSSVNLITLYVTPYGISSQIYDTETFITHFPNAHPWTKTYTLNPSSDRQVAVEASKVGDQWLFNPTKSYDAPFPPGFYTSTFSNATGTLLVGVKVSDHYFTTTLIGPTSATLTATLVDPSHNSNDDNMQHNFLETFGNIFLTFDVSDATCASAFSENWYQMMLDGGRRLAPPMLTLRAKKASVVEHRENLTIEFQEVKLLIDSVKAFDDGNWNEQRCHNMCSNCFIFFSTAYVYYWPVESPNTACLFLSKHINDDDVRVNLMPRGLSQLLSVGVSTVVRNDRTLYVHLPSRRCAHEC